MENSVKLDIVVPEMCSRMNRQTQKQTDTLIATRRRLVRGRSNYSGTKKRLKSLCSASDVSWQGSTARVCCCALCCVAAAAERRAASIDISCSAGPQQQTRGSEVRAGEWDIQTNGHRMRTCANRERTCADNCNKLHNKFIFKPQSAFW